MENLTKENFWNEMQNKYPLAFKDFSTWIDNYKKANNWNSLFPITERKKHWMDIKFHHLPIAMQMGIWNEYLDVNSSNLQKCQNDIELFMNATQEGLEESKS